MLDHGEGKQPYAMLHNLLVPLLPSAAQRKARTRYGDTEGYTLRHRSVPSSVAKLDGMIPPRAIERPFSPFTQLHL